MPTRLVKGFQVPSGTAYSSATQLYNNSTGATKENLSLVLTPELDASAARRVTVLISTASAASSLADGDVWKTVVVPEDQSVGVAVDVLASGERIWVLADGDDLRTWLIEVFD